MEPPQLDISIPEFPADPEWINARMVRLGTLLGRHVMLVWFWDYCSLNSLRALPYIREWDRRYRELGLRVFGVHSPQFEHGKDHKNVEAAVVRLGIEFPVAPDPDYEIWKAYGNEVWPALYLWDRRGILRYYHFAEGAYRDTELAIQELLSEIEEHLTLPEPMTPLRDTDQPDALVRPPTPHVYLEPDRGARDVRDGEQLRVRYAGAGAFAVLEGSGKVDVALDDEYVRTVTLEGPRLYELVESDHHSEHELLLVFHAAARAYAFSFPPGVA